jgi:hypothetical protein
LLARKIHQHVAVTHIHDNDEIVTVYFGTVTERLNAQESKHLHSWLQLNAARNMKISADSGSVI